MFFRIMRMSIEKLIFMKMVFGVTICEEEVKFATSDFTLEQPIQVESGQGKEEGGSLYLP